jgi:hypothetical protein
LNRNGRPGAAGIRPDPATVYFFVVEVPRSMRFETTRPINYANRQTAAIATPRKYPKPGWSVGSASIASM